MTRSRRTTVVVVLLAAISIVIGYRQHRLSLMVLGVAVAGLVAAYTMRHRD